jgi:hypothetical protein
MEQCAYEEGIYEEGMLAYDSEKGTLENPYSRYDDASNGTNRHSDWLDGWHDQQATVMWED